MPIIVSQTLFPPELDDLLDDLDEPQDAPEAGVVPTALDDLKAALKRYQRFFRLEPDTDAADVILDAIGDALAALADLKAETRTELNAARRHDLQEALERSYERGLRAGPGVPSHHLAS
jgi:hypothetical protein